MIRTNVFLLYESKKRFSEVYAIANSSRKVLRKIFSENVDSVLLVSEITKCSVFIRFSSIYIPTPWRCTLVPLRVWEITVARTSLFW